MFGIGTTEILIILVVALIVIGPKKLPEVAKTLGKALGEFKRMSSDVKRTIDLEADRAEESHRTTQAEKELFAEKKDEEPENAAVDVDVDPVVDEAKSSDETSVRKSESSVGVQDVTGKEA